MVGGVLLYISWTIYNQNVHLFFFTFRSGDKVAAPVLIYKPGKSFSALNHKKPAFSQN